MKIKNIVFFIFVGILVGCGCTEKGEPDMINSILKITGLEAEPVLCPRVDDVGGLGSWQGGNYTVKHGFTTVGPVGMTPSALEGTVCWYDTETTYNGEAVYYDSTDTYKYWFKDTWVISLISDGTTPTNYFERHPDEITASGAGDAFLNGAYTFNSEISHWQQGIYNTYLSGSSWAWDNGSGFLYHVVSNNTDPIPPKTGWVAILGTPPAPTIEYTGFRTTASSVGSWDGIIPVGELSWIIIDNTAVFDSQIVAASVESTATWPPSDFGGGVIVDLGQNITLDLQKGVGEGTHYVFDGTYGTIPVATRYSYIFAGWFTQVEGGGTRAYDDDPLIVANDDDTLFARWVSTISGEVSCGQSMLSTFAISIGTDLFVAPLSARKTRSESVQAVLPIPPGEDDEA